MLKNEALLSDKCVYIGNLFSQAVLEITDMDKRIIFIFTFNIKL